MILLKVIFKEGFTIQAEVNVLSRIAEEIKKIQDSLIFASIKSVIVTIEYD